MLGKGLRLVVELRLVDRNAVRRRVLRASGEGMTRRRPSEPHRHCSRSSAVTPVSEVRDADA